MVDFDRWPLTRVWLWGNKYGQLRTKLRVMDRVRGVIEGRYTKKELPMLQNWASWYGS